MKFPDIIFIEILTFRLLSLLKFRVIRDGKYILLANILFFSLSFFLINHSSKISVYYFGYFYSYSRVSFKFIQSFYGKENIFKEILITTYYANKLFVFNENQGKSIRRSVCNNIKFIKNI